jgi:phospholipid/cholesterol/gamma-HCH transport system permease protein
MNLIIRGIFQVQEITLLIWRVARGIFRPPFYMRETIRQMDVLGFGSMTIILLTGFFTGAVLALNTGNTLQKFGVQNVAGQLVATSLIR